MTKPVNVDAENGEADLIAHSTLTQRRVVPMQFMPMVGPDF
jgi:hypothetical protein